MKTNKIIYWVTTGIVAAGMLMSAFMYLTRSEELMHNFSAVGIPLYLVTLLGIAKLLGAIVLVIPYMPKVKEWAYAGFAFVFIGAVWTHAATGTPWAAPLVFLFLLGLSYWSDTKLRQAA